MTAPTYRIETVRDFLAVPPDRRAECLREFGLYLELADASRQLLEAVADEVVGKGAVGFELGEAFEWIDDDANSITLTVLNPDDTEAGTIALR